jgi:hypothetical protein
MSSPFEKRVREELVRARQGHTPIASLHEGYAVILEEVDELKAEAWKKRKDRDLDNTLTELVQIATMARRVAEDLGLIGL